MTTYRMIREQRRKREKVRQEKETSRLLKVKFWSVTDELSSEIKVNDLQMLKVALYDIINNKKELKAASANSLFRLLHSEGYVEISWFVEVDCDLLFELFELTGLQRLSQILSKNYRKQRQTNIITGYRRMLVKLGKSLNTQQVEILAKLCNIRKVDSKNAWNLISRLTQGKIEDTIESLTAFEALLKDKQDLNHKSREIVRKKQEDDKFALSASSQMTHDTQEDVTELVVDMLEEKRRSAEKNVLKESKDLQETIDDLTLSIWDFAGQDLYYITHQYYAIDNSVRSPLDKSIFELRDNITEVAKNEPYMGEKMPLKWLHFLHEIEKLRAQNEHSVTFKQASILPLYIISFK
ncbi:uncharacterized protein [Antedon mediterranea]|uniref:uncharacterized protein n=1 Tax=Antedon mediterranea TaxID=105859 RepID=UPI003AF52A22